MSEPEPEPSDDDAPSTLLLPLPLEIEMTTSVIGSVNVDVVRDWTDTGHVVTAIDVDVRAAAANSATSRMCMLREREKSTR